MSLAKSPVSLLFTVDRRTPELVAPAKPTPREFKPLSDLDDTARGHVPVMSFYPQSRSMIGADPVQIIRKAIAEALVFYYPFAGRIREGPSRELAVECTGEGVLFVEADADVTLDHFGGPLSPPFPSMDLLLTDVPGSSEVLNSPLALIQVTRLKCGAFIFAIRYNHVIADAFGLFQFMFAIGEMARGAISPSVLPVWERHLLCFKNFQLASPLSKHNYATTDTGNYFGNVLQKIMCHRTFFFEPSDILSLRRQIPPHFPRYSSFEILSSCVWKCRVAALQPQPTDEMSLIWGANVRNSKHKHLIPTGYYGNALTYAIATSTAKEIVENPISYTLELMRNSEAKMSEDYFRHISNLMATMRSYGLSDLRYAGFEKVDFGWGEAVFAGPTLSLPINGFLMPFKTEKGENGVMLPMFLPQKVMERFEEELKNMLNAKTFYGDEKIVQSKL